MKAVGEEGKRGKIILISFDNKKNLSFKAVEEVICGVASCGYYFDKISRVAFNQSDEIVRTLNEAFSKYENIVLLCPHIMSKTLTDYTVTNLGAQFDVSGVLNKDSVSVFLLYSDSENRLKYDDIKLILDKKYGIKYDKTVIRAVGVPNDVMNRATAEASEIFGGQANFNISSTYEDFRIEILYSSETSKMVLDDGVRAFVKNLHDYIYAMEDIPLANQLYRLLKLRRMKIAVAESFTGGGVCKRLVEVPGVSEVFYEGLNTYSNRSKMSRLSVSELTLNQRGAVSAETALQMAAGLLSTGCCEVAISTTGIAGPKSDNTQKPVGLAYIGVGVGEDIAVYKFNFKGDRECITQTAINHALFLAYKRLK